MADSPTERLLPPVRRDSDEQSESHVRDGEDAMDVQQDDAARDAQARQKQPLYIFIAYSLSCAISAGGAGMALWGYHIVLTSPFDENSKERERDSYETFFWGMQSIIIFLMINTLYTLLNLHLARKRNREIIWPLNILYDLLVWASLIGFGVFNMLMMLLDRRLCDGWNDEVMYKKCDIAMFKLLVVEMVAVNLGLLVAVIHFILLIARCCGAEPGPWAKYKSLALRRQIRVEEEWLLELVERRRRLVEETEALEERRTRVRAETSEEGETAGEGSERVSEDLIDITSQDEERSDLPALPPSPPPK
ncbi:hypothetical protein B0J14DRAFT_17503 [Halenospora varia]|nr:hypothetical protein B0J14DRAFT_17503 [Halenospora varia]